MKVMMIVKGTKQSEASQPPTAEALLAMHKFNEELEKAGVVLDLGGLTPTSRGVRVQYSGSKRTVIDGPFPETKELIAGFWLWQVKSMDEAVEWVKRCPNPMLSDSDIEIRPFAEMEDFAEIMTPELREQQDRLQAQMEQQK